MIQLSGVGRIPSLSFSAPAGRMRKTVLADSFLLIAQSEMNRGDLWRADRRILVVSRFV
jgi:hypothetical protein